MRYTFLILSITLFFTGYAQPINDRCETAIALCPGEIYAGSTIDATTSPADPSTCYTATSTVWYFFTTNSLGGGVTISLTDLVFNPDITYGKKLEAFFFETGGDCDDLPYTPYSNCGEGSLAFDLNEVILLSPNTTYYVQVNGAKDGALNAAECTFNISISGRAVNFPTPTISISSANDEICQGEDEPITYAIEDCIDTVNYRWIYNGDIVYEDNENSFSTSILTEDGTLLVEIDCGSNCPQTATSNPITYTLKPVSAEAGDDKYIDRGDQTTLDGSGIGDPLWTPGTTLNLENVYEPISSPENTTIYYLTVENDGCFATDSVVVYVGELVTIFEAFSPNGDNINDKWRVRNSENFPNMVVNIYDRSGQNVFKAVNYTAPSQWWDGTFKGKDLPTSVYYYVIELNDPDRTVYKGPVHIIR